MDIQSLLVAAGLTIALAILLWRVIELIRILLQGKKAEPLNNLPKRIYLVIVNVFGQKKLLKDKKAGIMHAVIFWGFIVLFFDTANIFGTALFTNFTFPLIGHTIFFDYLVLLEDLFALFVLVAVIYAMARRLVIKVPRLMLSSEALIILVMILFLMVTILLMNGAHIVLKNSYVPSAYMPVSSTVALALTSVNPSTLRYVIDISLAIHIFILLSFIVYVPYSKHLHIMTAPFNVLLSPLSPAKGITPAIKDIDKQETFGAETIEDFTWKDYLDMYTCTECGRCTSSCPANITGKLLSPREIILDLKHELFRQSKITLYEKKKVPAREVVDNVIKEEVLWDCTTCRACEEACPVFINHLPKIIKMRQNLVMMKGKIPETAQLALRNLETNYNPWGISSESREEWASELTVNIARNSKKFEYLYFAGCAVSYDERAKKIAQSFVNILNKAGVSYAILGNEERCTGDPAKRMGNEYLAQTLANENITNFNKYGVKKIITTCPHCFNSIKNEYPELGLKNVEVIHHTEFIEKLVHDNKIKLKKGSAVVTYHDSCYLARYNDIYKEPREILANAGFKIKEMERNKKNGFCCGAGGGRMWMEEHKGKRINVERSEEALKTGASVVAVACPYCMTMLNDGIKSLKGDETNTSVKDIAEIVSEQIM